MKVAIIGRPNVGKSTLFNRLARSKLAIIDDTPGVTRDRKYVNVDLFGLNFQLLDTPGIDTFSKSEIAESMNQQSFAAIQEADVVFFAIDTIEGVTHYDKEIAKWLRSVFKQVGVKPVIVLKNKSDAKARTDNEESLGFGKGVAVSAEHNIGINDIYQALIDTNLDFSHDIIVDDITVKIAIVGRPNVGKSTLINAIIGEERLITGEESGITRDSISINWKFNNKIISLIDTAGQRKKSRVDEKIESLSVTDAWRYIRQANIVVVVMDIQNPFEKQDLTIARKVFDEGKVLVFAINKSDTVENPESIIKNIEMRAEKEFAQLPGVPCLLVSAKEKKGLIRIFNVALKSYETWSKRISTGELNRWFGEALAQNPPPLVNGLPIKLKYISQTNTKPPTFAVFANRVEHLPASYERYLLNHLRKSFGFHGVPLRLFLRQRKNPYAK